MDARPFLEIDMKRLDARPVGELIKLTKSQFDVLKLVERASALKFNGEIKRIFAEQIEEPEDGLVEYISERVRNRLSAAQEQLGMSPAVVLFSR